MVSGPSQILDYTILNAFTSSTFGGNPAVVIFLNANLPSEALFRISKIFNQPIASFLFPPADTSLDTTSASFGLRWFTNNVEVPLCGHGTLAAAEALFMDPELVHPGVELLKFETMHCVVTARRSPGGKVEIEMPASNVTPLGEDEAVRIKNIVAKAFGKDVAVKFVGRGAAQLQGYMLVELDASENLRNAVVDAALMAETYPYVINIFTSESPNPETFYETRMFAPNLGVQEDHVCGSANGLLGPYWARKRRLESGTEMFAKQVSARGGDIWVTVDDERHVVRLRGELKLVAKGQLLLD